MIKADEITPIALNDPMKPDPQVYIELASDANELMDRIVTEPDLHLGRIEQRFPRDDKILEEIGNPKSQYERVVFENDAYGVLDYYGRELQDQADPFNNLERGALLIGIKYIDSTTGTMWTKITRISIPTSQRRSAVSKTFDPDSFSAAALALDDDEVVVGWYHTHPNFKPGPSSTDEAAMRAYGDLAHITMIDNPKTREVAIFTSANDDFPNIGGYQILVPQVFTGSTFDTIKFKSKTRRTYWHGKNING